MVIPCTVPPFSDSGENEGASIPKFVRSLLHRSCDGNRYTVLMRADGLGPRLVASEAASDSEQCVRFSTIFSLAQLYVMLVNDE